MLANASPYPQIWIRPSQLKIHIAEDDSKHPLHLTFNLLRPPSISTVTISRQTILNLADHGIVNETFKELQHKGFERLISPYMQFEGKHAMLELARFLTKTQSMLIRRLRYASGADARALGHLQIERDSDDEDEEEETSDDDDAMKAASTELVERFPGGLPVSAVETAVEMLESGFDPRNQFLLQQKLLSFFSGACDDALYDYDIPLEESAQAWCIPGASLPRSSDPSCLYHSPPDPLGVLKTGEIYFRQGEDLRIKSPNRYTSGDVLEGPVLVRLYPHLNDSLF